MTKRRSLPKRCSECALGDCSHRQTCLNVVAAPPLDEVCKCTLPASERAKNRAKLVAKAAEIFAEHGPVSEPVHAGIDERLTPILEYLVRSKLPLPTVMRAIERKYITIAQGIFGSKTNVARALGVSRNTIGNKTTSRVKPSAIAKQDRRRYDVAPMRHRR